LKNKTKESERSLNVKIVEQEKEITSLNEEKKNLENAF
jgi:hypothetical protein